MGLSLNVRLYVLQYTWNGFQVTVMFGYTVLFSTVFPLAAALCGLLMITEMRVDACKIFHLVPCAVRCSC